MPRFNPRVIAVVLFAVAGYAAFHFMGANRTDWREFAASDDTKITAFALLGHEDYAGKDQQWIDAQTRLHDEIVLSQAPVKEAETRRELRQISARIVPAEYGADCVPNYRHALRFEKDGRTVDAIICFACGQMSVADSAGKSTHFDFQLPPAQGRDQFDAIFARLGLKQFKPYAKQ